MFKKMLKATILTLLLILGYANIGNAYVYNVFNADSSETLSFTLEFKGKPHAITVPPQETVAYNIDDCITGAKVCFGTGKDTKCEKWQLAKKKYCSNIGFRASIKKEIQLFYPKEF